MAIYTRKTLDGAVVEQRELGDRIAAVAQPIARGIDRVFRTNVANCGGCKKMRENLNNGMSFPQALRERFKPNQGTNTMTRLNCTITASDDNNIILETRGRQAGMKVIERDENAAAKLFAAIEDAIKANERPAPAPAPAKAQPEITAAPPAESTGTVSHS